MSLLAKDLNIFEISVVQDKHDPEVAKGSHHLGGRVDDVARMLGAYLSQSDDEVLATTLKRTLVYKLYYDGRIDDEELDELLEQVHEDFRNCLPDLN